MIVSLGCLSALGKHTFRLKVSIDETHQVQILECCRHLACVKASIVLWYAFSRTSLEGYTSQPPFQVPDNDG